MARNYEITNAMRMMMADDMDYGDYYYDDEDGLIDGISVARKINMPYSQVFKTLVTQGAPGKYYVFMLPVDKELDLKKAAKVVGEKSIKMLPSKELLEVTGYVHGGCSPVGMKKQFPTFVDISATYTDTICISGGRIGVQLQCNVEELVEYINGEYADITKNDDAIEEEIVEEEIVEEDTVEQE